MAFTRCFSSWKNYDKDGIEKGPAAGWSWTYFHQRRLGNEFKCAVWTASQSTRQSIGKSRIGLIDFAEDIQKAAIADLVMGLCQTPEEETEGIMRIFLAKNRRGSGKPTLRFKFTPNKMLLSPWSIQ